MRHSILACSLTSALLCALAPATAMSYGMSCSIDTPGEDELTEGACSGFWQNGPHVTTAYFELVHPLLGDGGSPPVTWSDSRCPNVVGAAACRLPVFAYEPLTVTASFTAFGTYYYEFSADALYETGF